VPTRSHPNSIFKHKVQLTNLKTVTVFARSNPGDSINEFQISMSALAPKMVQRLFTAAGAGLVFFVVLHFRRSPTVVSDAPGRAHNCTSTTQVCKATLMSGDYEVRRSNLGFNCNVKPAAVRGINEGPTRNMSDNESFLHCMVSERGWSIFFLE
jgi:hypothetical protein